MIATNRTRANHATIQVSPIPGSVSKNLPDHAGVSHQHPDRPTSSPCDHGRYADLMRDPVAAVRRIYDHFDLYFTADSAARLPSALPSRLYSYTALLITGNISENDDIGVLFW